MKLGDERFTREKRIRTVVSASRAQREIEQGA
jgi:hypothetical protein